MSAAALDPFLDAMTLDFDDALVSVEGLENALAKAGYFVDRLVVGP